MLNHYGWLACLHPGAKMGDYACSAENDFNVLGERLSSLDLRPHAPLSLAQCSRRQASLVK